MKSGEPDETWPGMARTPEPPYYAVIFTSMRSAGDKGYDSAAARMEELAAQQPGFLGIESARSPGGLGITVSYWSDLASISGWKANLEHRSAQETGRRVWYADYRIRISHVQRAYGKASSALGA